MSVDSAALLRDLKAELKPLIDDLRARCETTPEVNEPLREEWEAAVKAARTARSFAVWREDLLVDVAVAWLLTGVFVRFCEDNELLDPPMLGGGADRLAVAQGHRTLFFQGTPGAGNREWLSHVFEHAANLPGLAEVLAAHSPLWRFGPTTDGARRIIEFWERRSDTGGSAHDFTDPVLDTRFLGDLYQDLSDTAKKQYALLQTPIFVEEFILDRTLEPAIAEFGLDEVSLIDPTCGSGHFLLGAFARLFPRLRERHPNESPQVTAQRVLDAIVGIDLNPAAAVIARFRLLVAALKATGTTRLSDLPAFHVNVAVGDSLLHGRIPGQRLDIAGGDMANLYQHSYATEDIDDAKRLLFRRYHAVVGNPPYITVKDSAMNAAYRSMFESCKGKYALSVPFFERFFDLALIGGHGDRAGFVSMITANSFMKREMGKKLVEDFIPTWNVTHVIDTSGAYIPGHGTPTVIIFGRHEHPTSSTVRGVLGTRGEPSRPEQPSKGLVWTSIVGLVDTAGAENQFVTVTDLDRGTLGSHPWSIGGGGAAELKARIDSAGSPIASRLQDVGFASFPGTDEAFVGTADSLARRGLPVELIKHFITGEALRDWGSAPIECAFAPYDQRAEPLSLDSAWLRALWPNRTVVLATVSFGGRTRREAGDTYWTWYRWLPARYRVPLSIAFAQVSTHNQFVLDRGGKVFKQSAPVIKLPEGATLEDHLGLLALLNSATAGFWMKQVFHCKGSTVDSAGARQTTVPFEDFYDHDGTKLQQLPVPPGDLPAEHGRVLDALATERSALLPSALVAAATPNRAALADAHERADLLRRRMIAAQEELDWHVMGLYGLLDEDFTYPLDEVPPLRLGERAFEIVMARQMAEGELETTWFARHGSTPITEIPSHWPQGYRDLVQRRIDKIESDRDVALIERPECKRRWNDESWESMQERALRVWLLDRLESPAYWPDARLRTTRALADQAVGDAEFMQVAELYRGAAVNVADLVAELMQAEAVPFLAAWRYSESGLRKYAEWEATWDLQRREDAGENVGVIPVPPKYGREDFANGGYWPLRGKLDVPKERFVSYPGTFRENDPSPVMGWAGWNHLQRAQALAGWITQVRHRGAEAEALVPLLAGLWELVPWLRQWHNEIDPEYGERLGDFFAAYCQNEATALGLSTDDLAAWRAPAPARRTRTRR